MLGLPRIEHERVDRKLSSRIGPSGNRNPSRAARQRRKRFDRIFIAVLGMDGLAGAEIESSPRYLDLLPLLAGKMHFDAVALGIIEGLMTETCQVEVTAELAIDAREQIEVELRRDAGAIVIGGIEDFRVLHQVDADDEACTSSQHTSGLAQERAGFVRLQIADGRSREESGMRHVRDCSRQ